MNEEFYCQTEYRVFMYDRLALMSTFSVLNIEHFKFGGIV